MKNIVIKAYIDSVLHVIALSAFLKKLASEGNVVTGDVVVFQKSLDNNTVTEKDLDYFRDKGLDIVIYKPVKNSFLKEQFLEIIKMTYSILLKYKNHKQYRDSLFYFVFPSIFFINAKDIFRITREFGDNYKIILIEEGVGSYIRSNLRWLARGRESDKGFCRQLLQYKNKLSYSVKFEYFFNWLEGKKIIQRFCLLDNTDDGLVPNKMVCKYFKEVFDVRSESVEADTDCYNGTVLINSQPFFEDMGDNQDIECYKRVVGICNELNVKVVIKPHPREKQLSRYEKLGIVIDNRNFGISQEVLLAKAKEKPIAVIGFFSTTLVTSKLFFDIPAVSLGNLIDMAKLDGFGEDIKNFLNVFKNLIEAPVSFEELKQLLSMKLK